MFTIVVLPAPLGPSRAKTVPEATVKSTPSRTILPSKDLRKPLATIAAGADALVMALVSSSVGSTGIGITGLLSGKLAPRAQCGTVRLPLLLHAAGLIDEEVRERRHLKRVGLPLGGCVPEDLETLAGEIAKLLVLGDVEPPRLGRRKVEANAVHPL